VRFKGQPVDDDAFFDTAPFRLGDTFAIARPAADVWADLTADDTLRWCRLIKGVEWTTPRPFAVGTTRVVRALGGAVVLGERYFRWEEGRRKSFYVSEATLPLFRCFAEDYLVEELSPSSCRFTWTVASEAPPAARPGNPVNALVTRSLFRDTRRHFGAS
jgi:hypothetical protein